jgi:hypothetical protein
LESITNNLPAIALVLAGLGLVAMLVMQSMRISSLRHRMDQLTGGTGEGNLEDVLIAHLDSVHAVGQELDELMARLAVLESSSRHHFARQGLVRFNPFPVSDTGGDQSFALALLDEGDNGFIVTSLHSRNGTRIYAKAVTAGKVDAQLSPEETQALEDARVIRPQRVAQSPARSRTASRGSQDGLSATPVRPAVKVARPAPAAVHVEPDAAPTEDAEIAVRPAGKGQSKGEVAPIEAESEERTGARPGRAGGRS